MLKNFSTSYDVVANAIFCNLTLNITGTIAAMSVCGFATRRLLAFLLSFFPHSNLDALSTQFCIVLSFSRQFSTVGVFPCPFGPCAALLFRATQLPLLLLLLAAVTVFSRYIELNVILQRRSKCKKKSVKIGHFTESNLIFDQSVGVCARVWLLKLCLFEITFRRNSRRRDNNQRRRTFPFSTFDC